MFNQPKQPHSNPSALLSLNRSRIEVSNQHLFTGNVNKIKPVTSSGVCHAPPMVPTPVRPLTRQRRQRTGNPSMEHEGSADGVGSRWSMTGDDSGFAMTDQETEDLGQDGIGGQDWLFSEDEEVFVDQEGIKPQQQHHRSRALHRETMRTVIDMQPPSPRPLPPPRLNSLAPRPSAHLRTEPNSHLRHLTRSSACTRTRTPKLYDQTGKCMPIQRRCLWRNRNDEAEVTGMVLWAGSGTVQEPPARCRGGYVRSSCILFPLDLFPPPSSRNTENVNRDLNDLDK